MDIRTQIICQRSTAIVVILLLELVLFDTIFTSATADEANTNSAHIVAVVPLG